MLTALNYNILLNKPDNFQLKSHTSRGCYHRALKKLVHKKKFVHNTKQQLTLPQTKRRQFFLNGLHSIFQVGTFNLTLSGEKIKCIHEINNGKLQWHKDQLFQTAKPHEQIHFVNFRATHFRVIKTIFSNNKNW